LSFDYSSFWTSEILNIFDIYYIYCNLTEKQLPISPNGFHQLYYGSKFLYSPNITNTQKKLKIRISTQIKNSPRLIARTASMWYLLNWVKSIKATPKSFNFPALVTHFIFLYELKWYVVQNFLHLYHR